MVWSTPDSLTSASIPSRSRATQVRNEHGLVDFVGVKSGVLFRYQCALGDLNPIHRPTPLEGGNSRFRMQPDDSTRCAPMGAAVHLAKLADTTIVDKDGCAEIASKPVRFTDSGWKSQLEKIEFLGIVSEEDLPRTTDYAFLDILLRGRPLDNMFREVSKW